jgi:hypothetical protein
MATVFSWQWLRNIQMATDDEGEAKKTFIQKMVKKDPAKYAHINRYEHERETQQARYHGGAGFIGP